MRIPWTIWRATTLELWRLIILTTAVVVTVIAFAATVRPLAEGKLGPLDTLKFMFLAMPPMLQYALPFAAAFAATLTYHRMATDNELWSAAAGGVSHRTLLVPAAFTGVVLSAVLWVLSSQAIPRFLRGMSEMVTQDIARLLIGTIQRGQSLDIGGLMIYADRVDRLGPDADSQTAGAAVGEGAGVGAEERLLLTRLAAMKLDQSGAIDWEVTAQRAWVYLDRLRTGPSDGPDNGPAGAASGGGVDSGSTTLVTLVVPGVRLSRQGRTDAGVDEQVFSVPMPGAFADDPKYLTSRELAELPQHPDRMNWIDRKRQNLAFTLAEADTIDAIRAQLHAEQRAVLRDADRTLVILAGGLRWKEPRWELIPTGGRAGSGGVIEVEIMRAGPDGRPDQSTLTRVTARGGGIRTDVARDMGRHKLLISLELEQAAAQANSGAGSGGMEPPASGERATKVFKGLSPEKDPLPALLARPTPALLAFAADRIGRVGMDEQTRSIYEHLRDETQKLAREVFSKRHERWAMAASCLVMVLTGAVTAMRLAGRLPLHAYLWSFFPALVSVLTISGGQQTTHKVGDFGLAILWGGVGILAAYAAWAFAVVRRH